MSLKIKMETFMSPEINRRVFLKAASAGIVTLVNFKSWTSITRGQAVQEKDVIEIKIDRNADIGRWYFEPVGLYIRPGQKVRWICERWGSSATAFHPVNENHELRIPKKAKPFDSGILFDRGIPGSTFDYVFEHEGTYDYFSRNHEIVGTVGRIVVGTPGGPGEKPLGHGESEGRSVIFPDVRKLLSWLTSDKIVREKIVSYPIDLMALTYPRHESHF